MRGRVLGIIIVVLTMGIVVQAGGTYEVFTITSAALGEERQVGVFLPEGYVPGGPGFPVIYYFHGDGSVFNTGFAVSDLDQMIGEGLIDPVIVIEPDTTWAPYPDISNEIFANFVVNSPAADQFRDWVVDDVIPWVDQSFSTLDDRSYRYVTGHCLGAYGGWRLAMERPELFSGLSAIQGSFEWNWASYWILQVRTEAEAAGEMPPYQYSPENGFATRAIHGVCRLLLPNPSSPEGYDFLLDSDGYVVLDVMQRLLDQGIGPVFEDAWPAVSDLDLYFAVGEQDQQVPGHAQSLAAVLDLHGMPYVFRTYPGGHDYQGSVAARKRFPIHATFHMPIKATMAISPQVADLRLLPGRLRVTVELPGDLDVADIDCSTLQLIDIDGRRLDCPIGCAGSCEISDLNGNGRDDLSMWVSCFATTKAAIAGGAAPGDQIELKVRGELNDGRFFAASDSVTLAMNPIVSATE